MKNIIFIAPPAAGKGTQSEMLTAKYNIPHISTGSILRDTVNNNGLYSDYIKKQFTKGALVRDDIIIDILKERISKPDCENGYILDGFPRNIEQAKEYENILKLLHKELGYVIFLDINKEKAMQRIIGRKICSKCGLIYNDLIDELKPKEIGICDICHSKLLKRDDDNEEVFSNRYDTYLNETKPLVEYYKSKGVLKYVDSNINKETTFENIEKIFKEEGK